MARQHDYRYEYKKLHFQDRPEYTTDVRLKVYVRYNETDIPSVLNFMSVEEYYSSRESKYVIGDIMLSELIAKRDALRGSDVYLANIPIFFTDKD